MGRPSHHDEYKQFERATKRNSRPRTKDRPDYAHAEIGFVTGVDRGRYTVLVSGALVSGALVSGAGVATGGASAGGAVRAARRHGRVFRAGRNVGEPLELRVF